MTKTLPLRHRSVVITDRSSVGEARRCAVAAADALGFTDQRRSDVGIVATEAASNICSHAGKGEVLICPISENGFAGLNLLALDEGGGIRDVSRALEDGFSTAGTAGQGLGAIQRLSDAVSIYSSPDRGTVLYACFSSNKTVLPFAAINIPLKGETDCGDAYLAIPDGQHSLYMLADGLGHGPGASEAATEAVATVQQNRGQSLTDIINATHDALKKTRGAAMSVAIVDHARQLITYAGVGNISASTVNSAGTRSMVSQNGTLGAVLPKVQEFTYPLEPDMMLVMYSDGLNSRCSLTQYPGIRSRPLALIAGVLYRDFSRRRDDATVLVARLGRGEI
ncbi:MAG: anti-sigma regulatory factor [Acidobacteriaceae bacterium]